MGIYAKYKNYKSFKIIIKIYFNVIFYIYRKLIIKLIK